MRSKGKIAVWKDEKGYGFIEPADSGPRVFIHIKALSSRSGRPEVGDLVTYSVTKDTQGRTCAETAVLASGKASGRAARKSGALTITVAVLFLATTTIWAIATDLPLVVPVAYMVISFVTFVAYAIDKSAARSGRWRTSEGTLHALALAGGWPGALVAQQTLRHKSKKTSFRVVFWATVILNCAALVWLHTADGRSTLDQWLPANLTLGNNASPPQRLL